MSSHYAKLKETEEGDSDDNLMTLARKDHGFSDDDENTLLGGAKKKVSKVRRAKEELGLGKRVVFDEDGHAFDPFTMQSIQEFAPTAQVVAAKQQQFVETNAAAMKKADAIDKDIEKARRREIKLLRKEKEKAIRREQSGYQAPMATLGALSEDVTYDDNESESESESDDDEDTPAFKRQKLESLEDLAVKIMNH